METNHIKDMRDRLDLLQESMDDITQRNGQGSDIGRLGLAIRELSVSLGFVLNAAETDVAEGGTLFTDRTRPIQN
ncbi:hypothetical protein [Aestuariimicrobium sp. T2.26MG-19.2B]|uniref:hypothetical protein n=1 Tax=Aestuariimicrobium sp. T2.26MG-19.2B TaxID=3040679 RepID=UPI0024776B66|nr:hypothetical protein [Aestuariimicrobium sp. T2.26MG-19.2B]CAI9410955.1 hypothetical protein AESSP_02547 [Aestuariimicrobium sp. T2.26MG-19.2B]